MGKPGVLYAVVEDIYSMLEENVGGAQECYHVEECVLVLMDESRGREGAR